MKFVVGLGNPGRKYEGTRHNVGFETLARIAGESEADTPRFQFGAEVCQCRLGELRALLVAPQGYYNRSGGCVRQAVDFFKAELADLLVVCDYF
ncbi:MAG: aminoacyl-tRNA hydrolase, partial [Planctomycetota bacterium]